MYPLRFKGDCAGSADQNVVPLQRASGQQGRRDDEKSAEESALGGGRVFVRNIYVSGEKSQRKRRRKINRLDAQFQQLLDEALLTAADEACR